MVPRATARDLPAGRLALGAYDPERRYAHLPLDIEHWYVRQDEPELFAGAVALARDRRTLLVTIEPFPARRQRQPVLEAVAAGRADEHLRRLARVAGAAGPQVVLARWGHEMDLVGLYPWSTDAPELYRMAFRRVVAIFRTEGAANVRWVWSPAGEPEAADYYPGGDVVDYIGLTVLGDEGWDAGFGRSPQTLADLLRPRYARVAGFGKPILLAEVGVSGSRTRQAEWLTMGARSLDEFPALRAIVYFNDVNAPNNRLSIQPDWRLSPALLNEFADELRPARPRTGGVE